VPAFLDVAQFLDALRRESCPEGNAMQNSLTLVRLRWLGVISLLLVVAVAAVLVRAKRLHDRAYVPLRTVTVPRPYPRAGQSVFALAFSPDGRILADVEGQGGIGFWDAKTLGPIDVLDHAVDMDDTHYLGWSADGKMLAVGGVNSLSLLNIATGTHQIGIPNQYRTASLEVQVNHQGVNIAASSLALAARGEAKGRVEVWDTRLHRRRFMLTITNRILCNLAFSPDATTLAVATTPNRMEFAQIPFGISLYETRTGKQQKVFQWDASCRESDNDYDRHLGQIGLAFSPDGRILASAENVNVDLWNVQSGTLARTLRDEKSGPSWSRKQVAFSPDGRLVAAVGWEQEIRVWSVATGRLLQKFQGAYTTDSLAFSPDSKTLVTGGQDKHIEGTIALWDISGLR